MLLKEEYDRHTMISFDSWLILCPGTAYPEPEAGSGRGCAADGSSPYGEYCFVGDSSDNPNYGLTSFDNIFWSWLTIFQCVSLEGWTEVMYAVQVWHHLNIP